MKKLWFTEKTKQWLFAGLQVMIILLAMAIGYFSHKIIIRRQGEYALVNEAKTLISENSILEIPADVTLEHGMIRGMLETLNDPYTFFVAPAANEVERDQLTGSFGGIGVHLVRDTEMNWRLYPLPNSPASDFGIRDGDILIGVDDLSITKETDEVTVVAAVRGPIDKEVKITVQRSTEIMEFLIVRKDVPLPTVSWNLLPEFLDIGMVKINRISESTADEVSNAIQELIHKGADAFIIDLRDNGGGLVEAGVAIANLFLEKGDILHQHFKQEKEEVFSVKKTGPFRDISMVVLVNGNTASSAEIVAGALKKHERAAIIGSPTYGKTSIQYIFDLEDGSSIHITSGQWWIPGVTFPLQPDYEVMDEISSLTTIQKAVEVLGWE